MRPHILACLSLLLTPANAAQSQPPEIVAWQAKMAEQINILKTQLNLLPLPSATSPELLAAITTLNSTILTLSNLSTYNATQLPPVDNFRFKTDPSGDTLTFLWDYPDSVDVNGFLIERSLDNGISWELIAGAPSGYTRELSIIGQAHSSGTIFYRCKAWVLSLAKDSQPSNSIGYITAAPTTP